MELRTVDEIREALRKVPRAEWDSLSQASGVPRSTLEKIAYGVTERPSFDAAAALGRALIERQAAA